MHVTAIIPAAGRGIRLKSRVAKPLIYIVNKALLIHTLTVISKHPLIKDIIVVANISDIARVRTELSRHRLRKVKRIVSGGLRRQDSVRKGLEAISERTDFVLIHDAARPFITKEIISRVITEAKDYGSAIVGVPVKATIKKIKNPCLAGRQEESLVKAGSRKRREKIKNRIPFTVEKTLNRDNLWEIQTPQVFRKDLILKAYKRFGNDREVTDDAMLVERLGMRVRLVLGSYFNIKITTPEDLVIAKAIFNKRIYKS